MLYVINHPCLFSLVLAVTVSQIFFLLDSFEEYLARYFVACRSSGLGLMASSWLDWGDGLYRSNNRGNLHFISLLFYTPVFVTINVMNLVINSIQDYQDIWSSRNRLLSRWSSHYETAGLINEEDRSHHKPVRALWSKDCNCFQWCERERFRSRWRSKMGLNECFIVVVV